MIRIPDPTTSPCRTCGQPTVIAEFATGSHRVHCGTYRATCHTTRPTTLRSSKRPKRRPLRVPDVAA
jgi:hypothetical protein